MGLKANIRKTNLMVSGSEEELCKSKMDACSLEILGGEKCAPNVETESMAGVRE